MPCSSTEPPLGTPRYDQGLDGATHFKTRTLDEVRTEMSLHVVAYNLKRMIALLGPQPLIDAIRA